MGGRGSSSSDEIRHRSSVHHKDWTRSLQSPFSRESAQSGQSHPLATSVWGQCGRGPVLGSPGGRPPPHNCNPPFLCTQTERLAPGHRKIRHSKCLFSVHSDVERILFIQNYRVWLGSNQFLTNVKRSKIQCSVYNFNCNKFWITGKLRHQTWIEHLLSTLKKEGLILKDHRVQLEIKYY